ncbi:MAG TPA: DUF2934 domain-containing protein [Nitrospiria bacterium]|nr:DUF2934 domain-containing protein [Nitrospiria bacterium]
MAQLMRTKQSSPGRPKAGVPSVDPDTLHQRIAERAYQRFLERNRVHGHDVDDWLEAERAILAERAPRKRGRA